METLQCGALRTRLTTYTPISQVTTIATDAGLTTPPIAVEGLSSAPINAAETTSTTSIPSSTGVSAPTR